MPYNEASITTSSLVVPYPIDLSYNAYSLVAVSEFSVSVPSLFPSAAFST